MISYCMILNRLGPVSCKQSSVLRKLWITVLSCVQTVGQQSQNSRVRKKLLRSICYWRELVGRVPSCIPFETRKLFFLSLNPLPHPLAPPLSVNTWSSIGKEEFLSHFYLWYIALNGQREAGLILWSVLGVTVKDLAFFSCFHWQETLLTL